MFSKGFLPRVVKVSVVWYRVNKKSVKQSALGIMTSGLHANLLFLILFPSTSLFLQLKQSDLHIRLIDTKFKGLDMAQYKQGHCIYNTCKVELYHLIPSLTKLRVLMTMKMEPFENILGKRGNRSTEYHAIKCHDISFFFSVSQTMSHIHAGG